jgi:hypothetical protein
LLGDSGPSAADADADAAVWEEEKKKMWWKKSNKACRGLEKEKERTNKHTHAHKRVRW